jgi:alkanesulfonate monooxygenase SsuD/methylene tetrahydromethanopterin reductase-like flavin-dependent oxidoreductase (luciferase family)
MPAERRPQLGVKGSQWDVDWSTLLAAWELADATPTIDSAWLFDHFTGIWERKASDHGAHEALTVAAALAARTRRIRMGHLVLGSTYRHPALVARMATTIDHVAGPGRFVLGLGAGWLESEHRMYGWQMPSLPERLDRLEASVQLIRSLWTRPEGATGRFGPFALDDAKAEPGPVTEGGPPIWIGTMGLRRGLAIVARLADGWNANGPWPAFVEAREALLRHCEVAERDVAEIEISAQIWTVDRSARDVIAESSRLLGAGVGHLVFVVLASDGPAAVERLVTDVIAPLRSEFG